jgi:hypothetical protein
VGDDGNVADVHGVLTGVVLQRTHRPKPPMFRALKRKARPAPQA